jgi:hypothetical protein
MLRYPNLIEQGHAATYSVSGLLANAWSHHGFQCLCLAALHYITFLRAKKECKLQSTATSRKLRVSESFNYHNSMGKSLNFINPTVLLTPWKREIVRRATARLLEDVWYAKWVNAVHDNVFCAYVTSDLLSQIAAECKEFFVVNWRDIEIALSSLVECGWLTVSSQKLSLFSIIEYRCSLWYKSNSESSEVASCDFYLRVPFAERSSICVPKCSRLLNNIRYSFAGTGRAAPIRLRSGEDCGGNFALALLGSMNSQYATALVRVFNSMLVSCSLDPLSETGLPLPGDPSSRSPLSSEAGVAPLSMASLFSSESEAEISSHPSRGTVSSAVSASARFEPIGYSRAELKALWNIAFSVDALHLHQSRQHVIEAAPFPQALFDALGHLGHTTFPANEGKRCEEDHDQLHVAHDGSNRPPSRHSGVLATPMSPEVAPTLTLLRQLENKSPASVDAMSIDWKTPQSTGSHLSTRSSSSFSSSPGFLANSAKFSASSDEEIKRRLDNFYKIYCSEKLGQVPSILLQFKYRRDKLFKHLHSKYRKVILERIHGKHTRHITFGIFAAEVLKFADDSFHGRIMIQEQTFSWNALANAYIEHISNILASWTQLILDEQSVKTKSNFVDSSKRLLSLILASAVIPN